MTIKLYKIPDDRIVVSKTVIDTGADATLLGELSAHIKENTSIMDPVFEVAYSASYVDANYIYVSDWGRYYYITEPPTVGSQRMWFTCHVDVLNSFKSGIYELDCIVARQENADKSQLYLNDGMFKAIQAKTVVPYPFPQSFDADGSFVLTLGGES